MSESVAIPAALDELDRRLRSSTDQAELIQVLRALQRLRLSEADLCVHIECVRATNDATEQNEDIDENCLLALDLVGGYTTGGLSWDAATMAPIYLGAVLDREALNAGLAHAVHPNDLLPRRPSDRLPRNVADRLVKWVDTRLRAHDYTVEPADIYRTPKSAFTTRPAALLALPDRLALEALAEMISTPLDEALPPGVLGRVAASRTTPRGRASITGLVLWNGTASTSSKLTSQISIARSTTRSWIWSPPRTSRCPGSTDKPWKAC